MRHGKLLTRHILLVMATVLVFLAIFLKSLSPDKLLWTPDSPLHSLTAWKSSLPAGFLGRWVPTGFLGTTGQGYPVLPNGIALLLLPESVCLAGTYIFDVVLLLCAGLYFFHTRGVSAMPGFLGALALAFSGYSFTLISAGHISNFAMMPFAILTLAFIDRAIERRSLFHFAMTGVCAGIGFSQASDVMTIFCILAACYGIFKFLKTFPGEARAAFLFKMCLGAAVAAVFFFSTAAAAFIQTFTESLPGRENVAGQSREAKWEFATNWSMPPEEALEFLAPCVYGAQTGAPDAPYWGRLGQSMRWPETRQGLMNLRQHTVYLGVLQMVFAAYAIIFALWRGNKSSESKVQGSKFESALRPPSSVVQGRRAEILFWAGAWLATLLLALGRYAPLYRLFYALPYVSAMRAPVKFLHLTEAATACLFAFGVEAFFKIFLESTPVRQTDDARLARKSGGKKHAKAEANKTVDGLPGGAAPMLSTSGIIALCAIGSLFLASAVWMLGEHRFLLEKWTAMGLQQYSSQLQKNMAAALAHAGVLFLASALIIEAARRFASRRVTRTLVPIALLLVLCLDIVSVSRRYVMTVNKNEFYSSNHLVEFLKSDSEPFRYTCPALDGVCRRWMDFTFLYNEFEKFNPYDAGSAAASDESEYLRALGDKPIRLWQLANARYIIGPAQAMRQLLQHEAFQNVLSVKVFGMSDGRIATEKTSLENSSHALVLNRSALPRAALYYSWENVSMTDAPARIADSQWEPARTVLVSSESMPPARNWDELAAPVRLVNHAWRRIELDVEADYDGILLLNNKYHPSWRARVDGRQAELLRCNYLMQGVSVPAGRHKVVFSFHSPYRNAVFVSWGAFLVMMVWALLRRIPAMRMRLR